MSYLDLAKSEIGIKEGAGNKDNPVVLRYYADAGHPEIEHDETPWCAAFVGSVLARSGLPNTGSLEARSYLKYGKKLTKPVPGCIVVFWRESPSSWQGHVGFVYADLGDTLQVLGGNQRDSVSLQEFPKSQVLGYRMPIEPTIEALGDAGSKEAPVADLQTKVTVVAGIMALFAQITASVSSLSAFVVQNAVFGVVILAIMGFGVAYWWKQNRIKRHQNGQPLSTIA